MARVMRGAIVIFAKDADLTEVKTRLEAETNKKLAREFYNLSLKAISETLCLLKNKNKKIDLSLYWALNTKPSLTKKKWNYLNFNDSTQHNPIKITPLWTTSKNLATSLNHIYSKLIKRHDFVILIGSDSPQLTVSNLNQAIDWCVLNNNQQLNKCLIGPSLDGGFYLFAGNYTLNAKIWLNTKYSKNNTLKQLSNQLNDFEMTAKFLKKQIDIDTFADLKKLKEIFNNNQALTHSQQNLYDWLVSIIGI